MHGRLFLTRNIIYYHKTNTNINRTYKINHSISFNMRLYIMLSSNVLSQVGFAS